MKMNRQTKKKMANQRLKRIVAYYNAYYVGSTMYDYDIHNSRKLKNYYVLAKHQLDGSYYFVLSDEQGEIFIAKIIYDRCARIMRISETSKKYLQDKGIFDFWIEVEYSKRNRNIDEYYTEFNRNEVFVKDELTPNNLIVKHYANKNNVGSLELKKEYKDNYYFIVALTKEDSQDKKYIIAKIVWHRGCIDAVKLSSDEFEKDKEVFELWLNEAKASI